MIALENSLNNLKREIYMASAVFGDGIFGQIVAIFDGYAQLNTFLKVSA